MSNRIFGRADFRVPVGRIRFCAVTALTTSVGDEVALLQLARVDIDHDLALLAAVGQRHRRARHGGELRLEEVVAEVVQLLLGERRRREREPQDRHRRCVEAQDVRRRDAGRQRAQLRLRQRGDFGDRFIHVRVRLEKDLESPRCRQRCPIRVLDVVDRDREAALVVERDAPFHLGGGQAVITTR